MKNKLTLGKTWLVLLVAAFTTGMGNGSVFGAAVMCAVGRGPYESWGGWGMEAFSMSTFSGFLDWMMLIFGAAFAVILGAAMSKHGEIEANGGTSEWK
ncbi:MAG: hypothetical protein OEW58_02915 [Gammaproteobacteria bacterium]|nr:hypothetical protein [Gammaproteobacteria bacterium]